MYIEVSDADANAMLTTLLNNLSGGAGAPTLKFYTGSPPDAVGAITTQTLLGTLTCSDPVGSVADRELVFDAITNDASADAGGTIGFCRLLDGDGTARADLDCGTDGSGAAVIVNTVTVVAGGPIAVNSLYIAL